MIFFGVYCILIVVLITEQEGKGRLKYLLQQTEVFAHFAEGSQAKEKKPRGR
jgi:hypothetical protein